nr:hypothetical protein [Kibdelosporangium sp. MJ126-NF4]CTQ99081.1 hypothetical protein [Kibdelosporangium sp. MJ126-NF4]
MRRVGRLQPGDLLFGEFEADRSLQVVAGGSTAASLASTGVCLAAITPACCGRRCRRVVGPRSRGHPGSGFTVGMANWVASWRQPGVWQSPAEQSQRRP